MASIKWGRRDKTSRSKREELSAGKNDLTEIETLCCPKFLVGLLSEVQRHTLEQLEVGVSGPRGDPRWRQREAGGGPKFGVVCRYGGTCP